MEKSLYSEGYSLFLRKLRATRKNAGVTQIELAKRLDETQSFVSKCERGERRIDVVELRAFCRALGVPFNEFTRRLDADMARKRPTPGPRKA
jgi:transcriptional regulator with XRE-family HTH domain